MAGQNYAESQLMLAVKSKDNQKINTIIKQLGQPDEEFYNYLFDICDKKQINKKVIRMLLNIKKIDINRRNRHGETILHLLSQNGHFECVQYVIKKHKKNNKLKIDPKCNKKKTPFLVAAEHGHLNILKLLESNGADINRSEKNKYGAIHLAATNGHLDCIKYLIEQKSINVNLEDMYGDTPLLKAAEAGHENCVEYLLSQGADIHKTDIHGWSALHYSTCGCHIKSLKLLLKHGSNVNGQEYHNGITALIWAAINGEVEIVTHLINANANVDIQDVNGETALTSAAGMNRIEVVKKLVEAGANVNLTDKLKETALMKAARRGHTDVVKFLVEIGANIQLKNKLNNTAYDLANTEEIRMLLA